MLYLDIDSHWWASQLLKALGIVKPTTRAKQSVPDNYQDSVADKLSSDTDVDDSSCQGLDADPSDEDNSFASGVPLLKAIEKVDIYLLLRKCWLIDDLSFEQ